MKTATDLASAAARRLWLTLNRGAFIDRGPARLPRLLVDVSVIMRHDAATGIQRVVRSVWSQLAAVAPAGFDLVPVYSSRTRGYCYAPGDFLARRRKPDRVPVGVRPGDTFLGLDLAAHFLPAYADQLTAWRAAGASLHVVVYDLLPLARPDWFEQSTIRHFARWFDAVSSLADQALCISDTVAQDLRRRTIATAAHRRLKVGRIQLSGDIAGSLPSDGVSAQVRATLERARARPAVLMIGTIEPRKGYERAIGAFEHLWATAGESAPDLIIIGKRGWKTADLQQRIRTHPEHDRRLHWMECVSDEALTQFYEAAAAIFIASYDEGFGLPLVEAATHRRWALARDLPVFREQRLPNVLFFEDDSPQSLSRDLIALVGTAAAGPPPPANLPDWSWCVRQLIGDIGLSSAGANEPIPLLRAVS
jgi:glycosyltransferase involved in cell wall biosynthesis